jgi:prevent-host-death family protein
VTKLSHTLAIGVQHFVLSWLQLDWSGDLQEIGAFEAKNTLGSLLDRVERGEEIVITRHGKPVARLVASATYIDRAKAKAAAERIRARAVSLATGGFDWRALKTDRDEGRP